MATSPRFTASWPSFPTSGSESSCPTIPIPGGALSFRPFLLAFLDHYYPAPCLHLAPGPDAPRIAGQYQFLRRNYSNVQKATGLAGALGMQAADSGMLLVHSPFGTLRTAEVSPLLFRDLTTCEDILFQADSATGRITHAILGVAPMMAMERVPLLMSPRLHQIILGGSIIVFAALVIAALARIVRRAPDDGPTPVRRGRRVLTTIAIANLLFVVLLVVLASDSHALFDAGGSGTARRVLQMALALPVLSLLLSVVAVFAAVVRWNRKIGTLGSRIGFSAAVAVALVFLWSLERWNLLGWRM